MKLFKAATTVCCMALTAVILAPSAKADDWNRKTTITFSGPVEIPGVHLTGWGVLPAGTYVFKILDSQSDRHIVPNDQLRSGLEYQYQSLLAGKAGSENLLEAPDGVALPGNTDKSVVAKPGTGVELTID